jgi:hypothetical protein
MNFCSVWCLFKGILLSQNKGVQCGCTSGDWQPKEVYGCFMLDCMRVWMIFVFWRSSGCNNVQYTRVFLTWLLGHRMECHLTCLEIRGNPLLLWLVTSHKADGEVHSILKLLYNRKHKKGRLVVENASGILNQTFRKFFKKI